MSNFERITISDEELDDFLKHVQEKDPEAPDYETNPYGLQHYAQKKYGGSYSFKKRKSFSHIPLSSNPKNVAEADDYKEPAPSWFWDAWGQGANNSVTGLSKKIVLGDDLYNTNLSSYDPGIAQGTLEFVSGILHDLPFFYMTGGLGVTTAIASGAAKKEAAKQLSRYMFKDAVKKNAFNNLSQKAIAKEIGKHRSKGALRRSLLKKTDDAVDRATINKLHGQSLKDAKRGIKNVMATNEFKEHGIKQSLSIGGMKHTVEIGAPGMRRIFASGGLPMATQLAAHGGTNTALSEVVNNIAQEINPETGKPFGQRLAQGIWDRWSVTGKGFSDAFTSDDIEKIIMATGEGFIGGFMAGGFSMLSRASRVGALDKVGSYERFMKGNVQKKLVKEITKERWDVPIEAGVFTVSHKMGSAVRKATDFGYDPEAAKHEDGWGMSFVKNLIQFKAMRKVNEAKESAKAYGREAYTEWVGKASERKLNNDKKTSKDFDKIKAEGEGKSDKIINEEIQKMKNERSKATEKKETEGTKLFEDIIKLSEKPSWGAKEAAEFEAKYKRWKEEIIDVILENDGVLSPAMKALNKQLESIDKNSPIVREKLKQEREKQEKKELEDLEKQAEQNDKADTQKRETKKDNKEKKKKVKDLDVDEFGEIVKSKSKEGTEEAQKGSYNNLVKEANTRLKEKGNEKLNEVINKEVTNKSKELDRENKQMLTMLGTIGNAANKTSVSIAQKFAVWLGINAPGTTLKNFNQKHAQDFLDANNYSYESSKHLSRIMKFRNEKGISDVIISTSEMKLKAGKNWKGKEKETLEPKELADFDASVINTTRLGGTETKGQDRGTPIDGTTKISSSKHMNNEQLVLLMHLIGHHGSRQVALIGNDKTRVGIRLKDIQLISEGGKQYYVIKSYEKGYDKARTEKDKKKFIKEIAIENIAEANGVNYFKVLEKLIASRMSDLGGQGLTTPEARSSHLFTTKTNTNSKQGASVEAKLTKKDISDIIKTFVGREKLTPHRFRHSILQAAMTIDGIVGSKSKYFENFAKEYILNHVDPKSSTGAYKEGMKINPLKANEIRREFENFLRENKQLNTDKKVMDAVDKYLQNKGEQTKPKPKKPKETADKSLLVNEKGETFTYKDLINRVGEWETKNPTLKGKIKIIEQSEGNFRARFINGVVELVAGKAGPKEFFHENIHNIEKYVRALGDKKLTALFNRGIKLAKEYGMKHDKATYEKTVKAYKEDIQKERQKAGKKPLSKKQLEIEANREYFTELGAKWAARYDKAKGFEKLKMWGESFVASVKNFFGKAGMPDIVSIIGKKAVVGYNPGIKGMEVVKSMKNFYKGFAQKSLDMVDIFDLTKETRTQIDKNIERIGLDKGTFNAVLAKAGLPKELTIDRMSEIEGIRLNNLLNSVKSISKAGNIKRKKSWNNLNGEAHLIESVKGITSGQKNAIGEAIGLVPTKGKNVSLATASEQQLKSYIHFLSKLNNASTTAKTFSNQALSEMGSTFGKTWWQKAKLLAQIGLLPGDVVLRKILPKKYADRIADKFLDHFQTEAAYFGYGQYQVMKAMKEIIKYSKDNSIVKLGAGRHAKRLSDLLAYALDPSLAEGIKFKPWEQKFLNQTDVKNSSAYNAKREVQKLYDYMYESLFKEAKQVLNQREFEIFRKEYSKKFVNEYYTRAFTDEAIEHFSIGEGKETFIKQLKSDMVNQGLNQTFGVKIKELQAKLKQTKSENVKKKLQERIKELKVQKAEKFNELMDNTSTRGEKIQNEASALALQLITKPNYSVRNKFLLKRMPKFENTFVDANGKTKKTYKTDFENVLGRYIRTMSGYLATIKHFNEFSDIKGEFSTGKTSRDILDALNVDSYAGNYAVAMLKSRLGMNRTEAVDGLTNEMLSGAAKYSAIIGLSSPMSGLKNFVIGSAMTTGTFGGTQFLAGIQQSMKPEFRDYVTKLGGREVGAKELELTGYGKWWMDNVSRMTGTEAANRFIGVAAGRMTAENMGDILSGKNKSLFKMSQTEVIAQMKDIFKLKNEDIAFIRNYGLRAGGHGIKGKAGLKLDKRINEIMDKVSHYSHIKTQGATSEPFLPLWMQSGKGRALTLFYRMAYSGTHNIYTNMIKPATRGNLLPLVRYSVAGQVFGGALWNLYAMLFGQENPKKYSDSLLDKAFSNFSKAETLGLFGYLINPYSNTSGSKGLGSYLMGSGDQIFQPAIFRNLKVGSEAIVEILNQATGHRNVKKPMSKTIEQSINDMAVIFNHRHRFMRKNFSNNLKPTYDNIRSAKKQWMEESGWREKEGYAENFSYTHEKQRYYSYVKDAFYSGNTESAAQYVEALYYYLYDQQRFLNGQSYRSHKYAHKTATSQINSLLRNLNPVNLEDSGLGTYNKLDTKRHQFYSWLAKKDPSLHEKTIKLEKQYHYMMRQIKNSRKKFRTKYKENYYEDGQVFSDGLMFPPRGTFMGFGYASKEYKRQSNYFRSDLYKIKKQKGQ